MPGGAGAERLPAQSRPQAIAMARDAGMGGGELP
ncbi:MAG: hypothetical protein AVDCRST_MAG66-1359 [uncultured Pseudonocardia sp.]|uniref:Uncharacterized protein n=1 Tax=uncultured Pseudonocardia sp. TaxID=211455 RepID=A0A6J4NVX9_9PSEU|nr:MAG: hypothetical protein AVDCRST_MAG66-1359 [uncultured Pseudonocardia sp.]